MCVALKKWCFFWRSVYVTNTIKNTHHISIHIHRNIPAHTRKKAGSQSNRQRMKVGQPHNRWPVVGGGGGDMGYLLPPNFAFAPKQKFFLISIWRAYFQKGLDPHLWLQRKTCFFVRVCTHFYEKLNIEFTITSFCLLYSDLKCFLKVGRKLNNAVILVTRFWPNMDLAPFGNKLFICWFSLLPFCSPPPPLPFFTEVLPLASPTSKILVLPLQWLPRFNYLSPCDVPAHMIPRHHWKLTQKGKELNNNIGFPCFILLSIKCIQLLKTYVSRIFVHVFSPIIYRNTVHVF